MEPDFSGFYNRLSDYIERAGLKATDPAKEFKLSDAAFTHYKNGRIPATSVLYKLAKKLNVSMEFLLDGEDVPLITPGDKRKYAERTKKAEKIRPKWPSFDATADAIFTVYESDDEKSIIMMETLIHTAAAGVSPGKSQGPKRQGRHAGPS